MHHSLNVNHTSTVGDTFVEQTRTCAGLNLCRFTLLLFCANKILCKFALPLSCAAASLDNLQNRSRLIYARYWYLSLCCRRCWMYIQYRISLPTNTHLSLVLFLADMVDPTGAKQNALPAMIRTHVIPAVFSSREVSHMYMIHVPVAVLNPTNPKAHEGPGSLLSYLKGKGWANELSAGCSSTQDDFTMFEVLLRCTCDRYIHVVSSSRFENHSATRTVTPVISPAKSSPVDFSARSTAFQGSYVCGDFFNIVNHAGPRETIMRARSRAR